MFDAALELVTAPAPLSRLQPDAKRPCYSDIREQSMPQSSLPDVVVPKITITKPPSIQPPALPVHPQQDSPPTPKKDVKLLDPFYGSNENSLISSYSLPPLAQLYQCEADEEKCIKDVISSNRNCDFFGGSGGGKEDLPQVMIHSVQLTRDVCYKTPPHSPDAVALDAPLVLPPFFSLLSQKNERLNVPPQRKGAWTKEEDKLVLKYVAMYGKHKWAEVAKGVPGRDRKQCRERYLNHLFPEVRKEAWTKDEDAAIVRLHGIYGNAWADIARCLCNGRSPNAVKNRWYSFLNK